MKHFSLVVMLLAATLCAQNMPQNFTRGHEFCSYKKQNSQNPVLAQKADLPHSYNVLNYKLNLDIYNCFISPYPKSYTASVIITARADSSLNYIDLNAVNTSLAIDAVSLAGASFTHSGNILRITLDRQYLPGEVFDVKINYRHNNVSDGAVYVSNGFFFTDCEPEGARKWFPCWDKPSDKATVDLTARVPATVKMGSSGRLADSTKTQDTIYYRWISRDNVATYLVVISAKVNYNLDIVYWKKLSNPNDSIPMRFYWNAGESTTSLNAMKNVIGPMTTYYSQKFTEHPFEKNGFATLNNQFTWGGMENQTLTSLCPNCWSENLISHEFAHQWFGDMITCATWADITLNEGFATFCEALWYEKTGGYSSYKQDILNDASSYMSSNPGWPIYNPDWAITTPNTNTLFNTAITYNKGACVLHMLRYVMGDTLFFRGLRTYANNPMLKYQSAVLEDLKNVMSTVYGEDLGWFFDGWYKQPNHPTYQNKYYITQATANEWIVGFIAYQNQTNSAFHKMYMDIKVSFSGGTDTTIRVFNSVNDQQFTWRFTKQPASVTFDPDNNIVLKTAQLTTVTAGPALLSPLNNATVPSQPVTLSWTSVAGATSYKVHISIDPNFGTFVFNGTAPTNSLQVNSLTNQSKYYWRVAAVLSAATSAYSETWAFMLGTNCRDINMVSGWNLVSSPFQAANMAVSALFPQSNSPAYGFGNGYNQTDVLETGKGYWLRFPNALISTVCGNVVSSNQVALQAGWNLIGGYQNNYPVNSITTNPAGIITSFFYGYEEGYIQASTLLSGKGYWIRVSQPGSLVLPTATLKSGSNQAGTTIPSEAGKLIIRDKVGKSVTLYLSPSGQLENEYSLPPLPPSGIFDVRFENQSRAASLTASHRILLQGCEFPVVVRAENVLASFRDAISGKMIAFTLQPGESAQISNEGINQLIVEGRSFTPLGFSLGQNYPNPFNPETRISFSVPEKTALTIDVYNQLGENVGQIASGIFDAGFHEVTWNAGNLPSGIYFYEFRAKEFRSVKKMTYIR